MTHTAKRPPYIEIQGWLRQSTLLRQPCLCSYIVHAPAPHPIRRQSIDDLVFLSQCLKCNGKRYQRDGIGTTALHNPLASRRPPRAICRG